MSRNYAFSDFSGGYVKKSDKRRAVRSNEIVFVYARTEDVQETRQTFVIHRVVKINGDFDTMYM